MTFDSAIISLCVSAPQRQQFRLTCVLLSWFLILSLLVALTGCGDGKSSVGGTVTLDDQPVASGTITFVKAEGDLVREGAVIRSGEFQTALPPGKYKVELNAQKVIGKRKQKGFDGAEEEVELTDELFPPRFNEKTELIEEIKPGSNTLTLDLKSAK
jgi:hypothetical protein